MPNYVLLSFLGAEFAFLASGILILAVSILFQSGPSGNGALSNVASSLLLQLSPLTAGIVNAIFIFVTFAISVPSVLMPQKRMWLRAHSWMVLLSAMVSLVVGLDIWFSTLRTRSNLNVAWGELPTQSQSQLQQAFNCCGYLNPANPPFITDNVCTDQQTAQKLGGCVTPFSNFANSFLDVVFTAMFGAVALDVITFFASVVLLKDRAEQERYRLIDRKFGSAAL